MNTKEINMNARIRIPENIPNGTIEWAFDKFLNEDLLELVCEETDTDADDCEIEDMEDYKILGSRCYQVE